MSDSEARDDGTEAASSPLMGSDKEAANTIPNAAEGKTSNNMERALLEDGKKGSLRQSPPKKRHGRFHVKLINEREPGKGNSLRRNGDKGKGSMNAGRQESTDETLDHVWAAQSFGHTVEAVPKLDHYRNRFSLLATGKKRPTLYELHEPKVNIFTT